jgi:hypothetical protein
MRHVVKPPQTSFKRHTKAVTHTGLLAKVPLFEVVPKSSAHTIDKERLKRGERIARNKLVSRFGNFRTRSVRHPAVTSAHAEHPAPVPTPKPAQPSSDIFERALAQADSHNQPPVHQKHTARKGHHLRQLTSVAASSLAILLIIGFIAYQNAAAIQIHLAASRAGMNATLPGWQPNGYAATNFKADPGTVSVSFLDGTAQHSFSITQTVSRWNTAALFNNFVYANSDTYSTVQAASMTIFTYGNNNATWVNNGIWYKLSNHASLTTNQIVDIAASM